MSKSILPTLTLVVLMLGTATVGNATVTIYTDRSEWETVLGGQFLTEDFADAQLNDGLSFVSAEPGNVNPAWGYYQDVLTSTSNTTSWTIWCIPQCLSRGLCGC